MEKARVLLKVGKKTELNIVKAEVVEAITVKELEVLIKGKEFNCIVVDGLFDNEFEELESLLATLSNEILEKVVIDTSEFKVNEVQKIKDSKSSIKLVKNITDEYKEINKLCKYNICPLVRFGNEKIDTDEVKETEHFENNRDKINEAWDEKKEVKSEIEKHESVESTERVEDKSVEIKDTDTDDVKYLKDELRQLREENRVLNEEYNQVYDIYKELMDIADIVENPVSESVYNEALEEIRKLQKEYDTKVEENERLRDKNSELSSLNEIIDSANIENLGIISNLKEEIERLKKEALEVAEEKDKVSNVRSNEGIRANAEAYVRNELMEMMANSIKAVAEMRRNMTIAMQEQKRVVAKSNKVISDNTILQAQVEELQKLAGNATNSVEVEEMKKFNDSLTEENKNLRIETNNLRARAESAEKRRDELKENRDSLLDENEVLKKHLEEANKRVEAVVEKEEVSSKDRLRYGQLNNEVYGDKIITVASVSACGVTTTAVSLARVLSMKKRVCVVDFNLSNPQVNFRFVSSSKVEGIPDTDDLGGNKTSMGIIFNRDFEEIEAYKKMLYLKPKIDGIKEDRIYFLSGALVEFDKVKIETVKYEKFLSSLCKDFDYIIFDFGRIGSCKEVDNVYKEISRVAFRNIFVTSAEIGAIYNMKIKIKEFNLSSDNTRVLVNMERKAISDTAKRYLGDYKYGKVQFDLDVFGQEEGFSSSSVTSSEFNTFCKKIMNIL